MATIVTRAGKGSPLTNAEVDANFVNLNNDKLEVATAASTYAPLTGTGASGTWNISITGNAATATNGVVTTGSYANPTWITSLAETKVLPSQTGNSGKFLTTNGSSTSWGTVDLTPYLTTATAAATYAPLGGAGTSGTWSISITGNAATVTNGVVTTGGYADPSWITSLAGSKVSGNITGNAANVTGTVAIANGGTGSTSAAAALTALGAYPAANPSGYTTNTGTVTSVSGTGTASGLSLSGTVTTSGNITLSGTVNALAAGTYGISITGNAATVTDGVYKTGNQTIGGQKTFNGGLLTITGVIGSYTGQLYIGSRHLRNVTSTNSWEMVNAANTAVIYTLDNAGNLTAAGDVTSNSDERLKENIEVIPNALAKVESVRGVTFTRKADKSAGMGVVAQEIRKVAPEVVMIGADGMMSVSYGNLVGLLIEAVKDLSGQVKELKQKVGV